MDKLKEMIMNQAKDGKITCKEACEIASKMGIENHVVGKIIDEKKIKIIECQLGCFG